MEVHMSAFETVFLSPSRRWL